MVKSYQDDGMVEVEVDKYDKMGGGKCQVFFFFLERFFISPSEDTHKEIEMVSSPPFSFLDFEDPKTTLHYFELFSVLFFWRSGTKNRKIIRVKNAKTKKKRLCKMGKMPQTIFFHDQKKRKE